VDYLLQVFKALANDRRLQTIELLLDRGDLPIEGIASRLKIPLATCCRNLKVLERTYLVSSRRRKGYEPISKCVSHNNSVMPAKAGIQKGPKKLDSRLRGNDDNRADHEKLGF
jgi:predicted transcriptional regulator